VVFGGRKLLADVLSLRIGVDRYAPGAGFPTLFFPYAWGWIWSKAEWSAAPRVLPLRMGVDRGRAWGTFEGKLFLPYA